MKVWKVILATLVIFSAGVFAGVKIAEMRHANFRAMFHERWQHESPERPPMVANSPSAAVGTNRPPLDMPSRRGPFRNMGRDFMERIDRELQLAPEQRKRIETILDESRKQTREIWSKIEPEMREEMKKSRELIREVLRSDQNQHFDELMKHAPRPPRDGQRTNAVPSPRGDEPSPQAQEMPAKP